jgi:phage gpG-like protein
MAIKNLTATETNVSQVLNLEDLFGVSFEGERALRLAIAQRVIDHIKERTQSGKPAVGASFKPYSTEYMESAEFKILKGSSTVNLTLTGNMLADMDVLEDGPNTVVIGFSDATETAKAFRHHTGADKMPERPFFGVTDSEVTELIEDEFGAEIQNLRGGTETRTIGELFGDAFLMQLLDDLDDQGSVIGGGFGI